MAEHTEKLEGLLYAQAMQLAEQHLASGHEASGQIGRELQRELQQLQAGEEQRFQLEAEQLCRQMLQSAKIRRDTEEDRLRWTLVQGVLEDVHGRLERIADHPERYREVLGRLLAEAAAAIPQGELVAELNPRDIESLQPHWEALAARAAPGRKVALAALTAHASGGMVVRSEDGRVRVDNTFEGRLARLQDKVLATVMDQLFKQAEGPA